MNSPFVIEQATHLARRTADAPIPRRRAVRDRERGFEIASIESPNNTITQDHIRIVHLFRHALGRAPTDDELRESLEFTSTNNASATSLNCWEQLAQVLLMSNEFAFVD
jgi:hypothetical protein